MLIWVFAGRTCHFVGFLGRRLKWKLLQDSLVTKTFHIHVHIPLKIIWIGLIWIYTVCPDLSVWNLRIKSILFHGLKQSDCYTNLKSEWSVYLINLYSQSWPIKRLGKKKKSLVSVTWPNLFSLVKPTYLLLRFYVKIIKNVGFFSAKTSNFILGQDFESAALYFA